DKLLGEMDLARQVRIENRTLFSANHLQAFLDRAPKHVTSTASAPFSFIRASREQNPVGEEFATHVGRFLRLCIDGGAPEQFITSCTASAIIIDSFPPGMHRKFRIRLCLCERSHVKGSNHERYSKTSTGSVSAGLPARVFDATLSSREVVSDDRRRYWSNVLGHGGNERHPLRVSRA
ncbi:hypothetical protein LTR66_008655, partial [Elasticomyces elasticus]